jgi:hypothetical protein
MIAPEAAVVFKVMINVVPDIVDIFKDVHSDIGYMSSGIDPKVNRSRFFEILVVVRTVAYYM